LILTNSNKLSVTLKDDAELIVVFTRRFNSAPLNNDNKLEVGMICDGYLMRIDNLTPNNFFNSPSEDTLTRIYDNHFIIIN
jgi:hypothetical protein